MTFIKEDIVLNNVSRIIIESWFIPMDILMVICTTLVVIISLIFLLIILLNKTCHRVQMVLVANSYLSIFITGCTLFSCAIFSLENDRKNLNYQDKYCIIRGYILNSSATPLYYSFFLEALYRYLIVVYPNILFYQSFGFQISIILLTWIIGFIYPIPYTLNNGIIYNIDNQICQTPLGFSLTIIYVSFHIYLIPILLIIFIYLKLLRYIHKMNKRITPVNTLSRAKNQLKMIQRTIILVTILIIICFPLFLFALISFFTSPPRYHFRIGYIFVDISLIFIIIILFLFTKPLKLSMMKICK